MLTLLPWTFLNISLFEVQPIHSGHIPIIISNTNIWIQLALGGNSKVTFHVKEKKFFSKKCKNFISTWNCVVSRNKHFVYLYCIEAISFFLHKIYIYKQYRVATFMVWSSTALNIFHVYLAFFAKFLILSKQLRK